jgi:leader peptidase (prepilin peptidase)/N-methyltransferase
MTLTRIFDAVPPALLRTLATRLPVALALALVAVLVVGIRPPLVGLLSVALVTEELCRVDVAERRLPNRLVLPLYPAILTGIAAEWATTGTSPLTALGAGAGYFGFLLVLCIAGGMGMGDVKLGGALGLALGALGVGAAASGLLFAFVLGAIGGVVALTRPRIEDSTPVRSRRIPFGPFLLAGFWFTVVWITLLPGRSA